MDNGEARRVIVRVADGGGFNVVVEPPLDTEPVVAHYPTHKEARGYAGGLRMVRGWRVHDEARA